MEIKGLVEGFYGPPYKWPDRFYIIRRFRDLGFNYYLYGPKGDPYHRKGWSELYPEEDLANFRKFNKACRKMEIDFNYGLTPGDDINLVIRKFRQLRKTGIDDFAVFFDDLRVEINPDLAKRQARIANLVLEDLIPKTLILCPTQYSGLRSPYLESLARNLDKRIFILWTGPKVVSKKIKKTDLAWLINLFGKRVILWDNYPVNDYDRSRIFLGPFRGRDPAILKVLAGYLANPMNQPRISLIPLFTLAAFLQKGRSYKPSYAIRTVLKQFGLAQNNPLIRQFFPSPINPRMSYETRLLKERDWTRLIPIITGWQRLSLLDGQEAIDNLILARDLLIDKVKKGKLNKKKLTALIVSRRGEKDCYFENQVLDFLLTKNS